MAPQASKKYGLQPPDHRHIGIASCTSNGIDSEQVPGPFSVLTSSPLAPQASAQGEKRFLTPFSCLSDSSAPVQRNSKEHLERLYCSRDPKASQPETDGLPVGRMSVALCCHWKCDSSRHGYYTNNRRRRSRHTGIAAKRKSIWHHWWQAGRQQSVPQLWPVQCRDR